MSTVRPIDGNALDYGLATLPALNQWSVDPECKIKAAVREFVNNAPTLPQPEPAVEGDAISRAVAIAELESIEELKTTQFPTYRICMKGDVFRLLRNLPCAQPEAGVDCVTAEDVVEGIVVYGVTVYDIKQSDAVQFGRGGPTLPKKAVAAMIDTLDDRDTEWPEGHRRNPTPKEPTLLERTESFIKDYEGDHSHRHLHGLLCELKAAIERERKEGE